MQTPSLHCAFLLALLAAPAAAQVSVPWIAPTGGTTIAIDEQNNVFTALPNMTLGSEIELTKRDLDGNLLWTASFDQTDPTKWEDAPFVAVDSQGNAIVSATRMSGFSSPVNAASVVTKFSPNGQVLWQQVYESSFDSSFTRKCLVDENDNIYVLGMGSGPPGYVTKIKKFAPDGTPLWSYFDADGIGRPINMKFAPDGDLILVGRSLFGSLNGYARIDRQGQSIWSLVGVASPTIGDAAADGLGNTYIVHGEAVLSKAGTVVRKLGPNGGELWQTVQPSAGFRIEVGIDNQPVICGFPTTGTPGAAFFKLDAHGGQLWSNLDADGPLALLLHAYMLLDESGDAYLAASTLFEMAVCKVNRDGSSAWTQTVPGGTAHQIALGNSEGSVFVVGLNTARILDPSEGLWQDLGLGLAGAQGTPKLVGEGAWTQGGRLDLVLVSALGNGVGGYVLGASPLLLPLLGGTLVPALDAIVPLATDSLGRAAIGANVNNSIPSGTNLWIQSWVFDPADPLNFSASNALVVTAP